MKKRVLTSMVAAAAMGVLTPLTSHAFGLGKINVMSALNEPFKAEIDVTALRPEEKDNLQVQMASQSEFDKAGLSHSMLLNQMQFDIVQRGGQHKILITSKQAIKEPFLDFLVTATAGSGVMLREYTVLLDPPEYVLAETRPASARPAPTQTAPIETTSRPTTTRYQYADSSSGFSGSSYKVKRSDTLWNVALHTRPADDLTVHQMMMALQKRNPSAFTNDNVNGLKAGVTLQIPSRSEIEALSSAAARQAFAEQTEAWKNRSRPATTQVAQVAPEPAAPETVAPAVESSDVAEPAASPVQTAETNLEAPEARLQLVAPEEEVSAQQDASPNVQGNNQINKLTEQLTLAQETIEAQAQENIDLQERMALLEEQIETMRRMLSVEDTDLARMQAMLEDEAASVPTESAEQPAMLAEDATSTQNDSGQEEAEMPSAEQANEAEQATSAAEPATTGEDDESVVTKVAQALNLDEAQVQTTFDKVKQFIADNKMPTILGLLLVLLVLWLIARRSNREVTWDEAVKKLDKADSKKVSAAVVTPEIVDNLTDAPTADDQLTEVKTAAELVEQADMFVGYADYVQAKSALEQARALEPANTLVAYKTLFVLYKLNQADEFIELAEQSEFETDSFEWSEVSQWGKELAPDHALFVGQAVASSTETEEVDTTDLAFNELETATGAETSSASDDDIDLDVDAEVTEADSGHIEFNLDDFATSKAADDEHTDIDEDAVEPSTTKQVEDDLLSFDTNFSSVNTDDDVSLNIDTDDSEPDANNLSFDAVDETVIDTDNFELDDVDLPADTDSPDLEFDIGDLDDIDEAETKLDLASAYIDMGDPDGARSILNEVLVEGSEEQKNRAHTLLDSLS